MGLGLEEGLSVNGVKPSVIHSSLSTPWWTKKRPVGSYFFFTARSRGYFGLQKDRCQERSKKLLSDTYEAASGKVLRNTSMDLSISRAAF